MTSDTSIGELSRQANQDSGPSGPAKLVFQMMQRKLRKPGFYYDPGYKNGCINLRSYAHLDDLDSQLVT